MELQVYIITSMNSLNTRNFHSEQDISIVQLSSVMTWEWVLGNVSAVSCDISQKGNTSQHGLNNRKQPPRSVDLKPLESWPHSTTVFNNYTGQTGQLESLYILLVENPMIYVRLCQLEFLDVLLYDKRWYIRRYTPPFGQNVFALWSSHDVDVFLEDHINVSRTLSTGSKWIWTLCQQLTSLQRVLW